MNSLTVLMAQEHLRDLHREAAEARRAGAGRRRPVEGDADFPSLPSRRSSMHTVWNSLVSPIRRRYPKEAPWS